MAENSKIEWTDHIDKSATGRRLGAYKTAARRTGCANVAEWMYKRESGQRWCFDCKAWKPEAEFVIDRSRLGGKASRCKGCISHASRASEYGLSKDALSELQRVADGICQICKRPAKLVVDHDHATEIVRGLLCDMCNRGIGMFGDDVERLHRVIAYLEKAISNG